MLIVTAVTSIGKPGSIAEFDSPAGSYWQIRLKNEIDLEISGEVGTNLIDFLLYGEVESERALSTRIEPGGRLRRRRRRCRWARGRSIDR